MKPVMHWCPKCKEKSARRFGKAREYDGLVKRVEICMNSGCGYRLDLDPDVPTVASLKRQARVLAQSKQLEFIF